VSSAETRARMQSVRQRDNASERQIRSLLHKLGFRFRTHRAVVPGLRRNADLVFVSARIAVFIDGCFWHSCPLHRTIPKTNKKWWVTKLAANQLRDIDTNAKFKKHGWKVVRIWEHEDPNKAALRIASAVRKSLRVHDVRLQRLKKNRRHIQAA
jgi:DNA mismatch endonuclease, patch repair protein